MTKAYYNEIDPFCAEWLRNLILMGVIASGDVDTRSVEDVQPNDLDGYDQCHFFAGIGVWSHALRLARWPDNRPIWTGSCPCQPFSQAGKGKGFADERHLWPAWHHLIRERRPELILGEQVAGPDGLAWLDLVHTDMEAEAYAFAAADICAAGVGAPHIRQRLYWLAYHHQERREGLGLHIQLGQSRFDITQAGRSSENGGLGHHHHQRSQGRGQQGDGAGECAPRAAGLGSFWREVDWVLCDDRGSAKWRAVEPGSFPLVNGTPGRVGLIGAYGNAIVAPLAAEFIRAVAEVIT